MIRKHMGRVLQSFHSVDRRLLERDHGGAASPVAEPAQPEFHDGLGGDSDGSLSGRRVSARERQSLARDGHRRRAKVRQEDAAARRGRAQGRTGRTAEIVFPRVESWSVRHCMSR